MPGGLQLLLLWMYHGNDGWLDVLWFGICPVLHWLMNDRHIVIGCFSCVLQTQLVNDGCVVTCPVFYRLNWWTTGVSWRVLCFTDRLNWWTTGLSWRVLCFTDRLNWWTTGVSWRVLCFTDSTGERQACCDVSCVLQTQLVNAAENINSQLSYFNEFDRISTVSSYTVFLAQCSHNPERFIT